MMVYALDGKPDILLCKRCVYEQAENFIRFCPVLEEAPPRTTGDEWNNRKE
jgi:hypothetical protein